MITGLLDTNILVDILRGYPPAISWLSGQSALAITPIIWLEILDGVTATASQLRVLKLLRSFSKIELDPSDYEWAIHQATHYKLSHNVGSIDCLIAAPAYRLNLPLYTNNLKHMWQPY